MKSGVLLSSSRLCDKFDRSMTFGKQETDDRTDYRTGDSRKKNIYNRLNGKAWLTAVVLNILG